MIFPTFFLLLIFITPPFPPSLLKSSSHYSFPHFILPLFYDLPPFPLSRFMISTNTPRKTYESKDPKFGSVQE